MTCRQWYLDGIVGSLSHYQTPVYIVTSRDREIKSERVGTITIIQKQLSIL